MRTRRSWRGSRTRSWSRRRSRRFDGRLAGQRWTSTYPPQRTRNQSVSWGLEVACIRGTEGVTLERAVPDVFAITDQRVGFEDATSVMRDKDLCAARIGSWIVVIDVNCRLSAATPYLKEASADGGVHAFRVASALMELHYRHGKQQTEHQGLAQCRRALRSSKGPHEKRLD